MLAVRKSHLKRATAVALLLSLTALAVVGVTSAAGTGVTILTPPIKVEEVYIEPGGLLGTFPIYDGNQPITFTWDPYPFAPGVNGSYRVSLWQNTTPFGPAATWVERKVAHHWASNPNGTTFTMGAFGFGEEICTTCPSKFVVQAETYRLFLDAATGRYEYEYTPVAAAYVRNQTSGNSNQTSEEFMFEVLRPSPPEGEREEGGEGCFDAWVTYCEVGCELYEPEWEECVDFCIADYEDNADWFCEECGADPLSCLE